eukprot:766751-Hanusia_phi.AAC.15
MAHPVLRVTVSYHVPIQGSDQTRYGTRDGPASAPRRPGAGRGRRVPGVRGSEAPYSDLQPGTVVPYRR